MLYTNFPGDDPAKIAAKRALAQRLLMNAQQTQPSTIGQGLGAIGDYIYAGRMNKAADAADAKNREALGPIVEALQGGMNAPASASPTPYAGVENVDVGRVPPPEDNMKPGWQNAPGLDSYSDAEVPGGAAARGVPELGGNKTETINNPQRNFFEPRTPEAAQSRIQGGRMVFKGMDDDQLMQIYRDPRAMQLLEGYMPGYAKLINEEMKYRQGIAEENRKNAFTRSERIEGQDFTRDLARDKVDWNRNTTAGEQGYGSFEEMRQGGGTAAAQKARVETQEKVQEQRDKIFNAARGGLQVAQSIQGLIGHEGLTDVTGPVNAQRGPVTYYGNEKALDALSRIEQLQGETFLQAYESLKGGGQITEIEGQKAERAKARLQRYQGTPYFRRALREFYQAIQPGIYRSLDKAGVPREQWPPMVLPMTPDEEALRIQELEEKARQ